MGRLMDAGARTATRKPSDRPAFRNRPAGGTVSKNDLEVSIQVSEAEVQVVQKPLCLESLLLAKALTDTKRLLEVAAIYQVPDQRFSCIGVARFFAGDPLQRFDFRQSGILVRAS